MRTVLIVTNLITLAMLAIIGREVEEGRLVRVEV